MPHKVPITVAMGAPLEVPHIAQPTPEQVRSPPETIESCSHGGNIITGRGLAVQQRVLSPAAACFTGGQWRDSRRSRECAVQHCVGPAADIPVASVFMLIHTECLCACSEQVQEQLARFIAAMETLVETHRAAAGYPDLPLRVY